VPTLNGHKNYCVYDIAYMCTWDKTKDSACTYNDPAVGRRCEHYFDDGVCRCDKAQDECRK
jgi:hypothetical protein